MNLETLVRALSAERLLTDWSARGVATHAVSFGRRDRTLPRGGPLSLGERDTLALDATVHRDAPAGRGSARFVLGSNDDVIDVLDAALAHAGAATGRAWRSPLPAAPARVSLLDPEIDPARNPGPNLVALAAFELSLQAVKGAGAAGAEILDIDGEVERSATAIITRRGLDARWLATMYRLELEVRRGDVVARVQAQARRREDLAPGILIADALDAAARRARALATPAGRFPVVMRAPALLHGGRGLLEAIVAQADPALERQGLVRYRAGRPIAPGAAASSHPLDVASDGTLDFGLRSAPLDERGDAVRRFTLVSGGIARDLALDAREAGLRNASPNGGARGLVVPPGTEPEAALLDGGPLLLVESLAWLELAPITGRFRAQIGLAQLVDRGQRHDVTGGILRGDALAALALSRRSTAVVATPEYRGPATWDLGELSVG